ncbi:MAG: trypsin-like peptidase domain-containing protein [Patescibacteria group bacterium]
MKSVLILFLSVSALIFASVLFGLSANLRQPVPEITPPQEVVIMENEAEPEIIAIETSTAVSSSEIIAISSSKKTIASTTTTSWLDQAKSLVQRISVPTSTTVFKIPSSTPAAPVLPPEQTINPQSILGIVCSYNYSFSHPLTGEVFRGETMKKGSGVIIDPRGYVITNRHILEWADEEEVVTIGETTYPVTVKYSLGACKAGRVAKGNVIPTRNEILTINPLTQVPVLGFTLQPIYVRNRFGMSNNEAFFSDFAFLYINGITEEGPTFGVTALPTSFEYAKILPIKNIDLVDKEVITYGFPGDVTTGKGSSFQTLYFTGSVGKIVKINQGDQYYKNTPLYIETKMEIYPGRSGSPVFWRGYVIGLVMAEDSNNRTNSYSVASDVILRDIQSYLN